MGDGRRIRFLYVARDKGKQSQSVSFKYKKNSLEFKRWLLGDGLIVYCCEEDKKWMKEFTDLLANFLGIGSSNDKPAVATPTERYMTRNDGTKFSFIIISDPAADKESTAEMHTVVLTDSGRDEGEADRLICGYAQMLDNHIANDVKAEECGKFCDEYFRDAHGADGMKLSDTRPAYLRAALQGRAGRLGAYCLFRIPAQNLFELSDVDWDKVVVNCVQFHGLRALASQAGAWDNFTRIYESSPTSRRSLLVWVVFFACDASFKELRAGQENSFLVDKCFSGFIDYDFGKLFELLENAEGAGYNLKADDFTFMMTWMKRLADSNGRIDPVRNVGRLLRTQFLFQRFQGRYPEKKISPSGGNNFNNPVHVTNLFQFLSDICSTFSTLEYYLRMRADSNVYEELVKGVVEKTFARYALDVQAAREIGVGHALWTFLVRFPFDERPEMIAWLLRFVFRKSQTTENIAGFIGTYKSSVHTADKRMLSVLEGILIDLSKKPALSYVSALTQGSLATFGSSADRYKSRANDNHKAINRAFSDKPEVASVFPELLCHHLAAAHEQTWYDDIDEHLLQAVVAVLERVGATELGLRVLKEAVFGPNCRLLPRLTAKRHKFRDLYARFERFCLDNWTAVGGLMEDLLNVQGKAGRFDDVVKEHFMAKLFDRDYGRKLGIAEIFDTHSDIETAVLVFMEDLALRKYELLCSSGADWRAIAELLHQTEAGGKKSERLLPSDEEPRSRKPLAWGREVWRLLMTVNLLSRFPEEELRRMNIDLPLGLVWFILNRPDLLPQCLRERIPDAARAQISERHGMNSRLDEVCGEVRKLSNLLARHTAKLGEHLIFSAESYFRDRLDHVGFLGFCGDGVVGGNESLKQLQKLQHFKTPRSVFRLLLLALNETWRDRKGDFWDSLEEACKLLENLAHGLTHGKVVAWFRKAMARDMQALASADMDEEALHLATFGTNLDHVPLRKRLMLFTFPVSDWKRRIEDLVDLSEEFGRRLAKFLRQSAPKVESGGVVTMSMTDRLRGLLKSFDSSHLVTAENEDARLLEGTQATSSSARNEQHGFGADADSKEVVLEQILQELATTLGVKKMEELWQLQWDQMRILRPLSRLLETLGRWRYDEREARLESIRNMCMMRHELLPLLEQLEAVIVDATLYRLLELRSFSLEELMKCLLERRWPKLAQLDERNVRDLAKLFESAGEKDLSSRGKRMLDELGAQSTAFAFRFLPAFNCWCLVLRFARQPDSYLTSFVVGDVGAERMEDGGIQTRCVMNSRQLERVRAELLVCANVWRGSAAKRFEEFSQQAQQFSRRLAALEKRIPKLDLLAELGWSSARGLASSCQRLACGSAAGGVGSAVEDWEFPALAAKNEQKELRDIDERIPMEQLTRLYGAQRSFLRSVREQHPMLSRIDPRLVEAGKADDLPFLQLLPIGEFDARDAPQIDAQEYIPFNECARRVKRVRQKRGWTKQKQMEVLGNTLCTDGDVFHANVAKRLLDREMAGGNDVCLLLSNKQAVGVSLMKLLAVAISHNRTIDGVTTGNHGGRMLSLAATSIYPCCEQTFNLLVDGLFFDLEHQIYDSYDVIVLTTPEFLSQGMQETLVERLQKWDTIKSGSKPLIIVISAISESYVFRSLQKYRDRDLECELESYQGLAAAECRGIAWPWATRPIDTKVVVGPPLSGKSSIFPGAAKNRILVTSETTESTICARLRKMVSSDAEEIYIDLGQCDALDKCHRLSTFFVSLCLFGVGGQTLRKPCVLDPRKTRSIIFETLNIDDFPFLRLFPVTSTEANLATAPSGEAVEALFPELCALRDGAGQEDTTNLRITDDMVIVAICADYGVDGANNRSAPASLSYEYTKDLLHKIILVLQRLSSLIHPRLHKNSAHRLGARSRSACVLEGETGTGKTYLLQQVPTLLDRAGVIRAQVTLLSLNHSFNESQLRSFVTDVGARKQDLLHWVILDEITSCDRLDFCKQLLVDRRFERMEAGQMRVCELPDNVVFVATCNPAASKAYDVFSLPKSLQKGVVSFPALTSEEIERFLRASFVGGRASLQAKGGSAGDGASRGSNSPNQHRGGRERDGTSTAASTPREDTEEIDANDERFLGAILACQKLVDENCARKNGKVRGSLRDSSRCLQLALELEKDLLGPILEAGFVLEVLHLDQQNILAQVLALYLSYGVQLQPRSLFFAEMDKIYTGIAAEDLLEHLKLFVYDQIGAPRSSVVPTFALKENLLVELCVVVTRNHSMLLGDEGGSKTLSLSLLLSAMKGPFSCTPLFKLLPRLQPFRLQLKATTEAAHIQALTDMVLKWQSRSSGGGTTGTVSDNVVPAGGVLNSIAVVVLEELGMAKKSVRKALHHLLDFRQLYGEQERFAFLSTANYTLEGLDPTDAALTSRLLVSRSPRLQAPDVEDLCLRLAGVDPTAAPDSSRVKQNVVGHVLRELCNGGYTFMRDIMAFSRAFGILSASMPQDFGAAASRIVDLFWLHLQDESAKTTWGRWVRLKRCLSQFAASLPKEQRTALPAVLSAEASAAEDVPDLHSMLRKVIDPSNVYQGALIRHCVVPYGNIAAVSRILNVIQDVVVDGRSSERGGAGGVKFIRCDAGFSTEQDMYTGILTMKDGAESGSVVVLLNPTPRLLDALHVLLNADYGKQEVLGADSRAEDEPVGADSDSLSVGSSGLEKTVSSGAEEAREGVVTASSPGSKAMATTTISYNCMYDELRIHQDMRIIIVAEHDELRIKHHPACKSRLSILHDTGARFFDAADATREVDSGSGRPNGAAASIHAYLPPTDGRPGKYELDLQQLMTAFQNNPDHFADVEAPEISTVIQDLLDAQDPRTAIVFTRCAFASTKQASSAAYHTLQAAAFSRKSEFEQELRKFRERLEKSKTAPEPAESRSLQARLRKAKAGESGRGASEPQFLVVDFFGCSLLQVLDFALSLGLAGQVALQTRDPAFARSGGRVQVHPKLPPKILILCPPLFWTRLRPAMYGCSVAESKCFLGYASKRSMVTYSMDELEPSFEHFGPLRGIFDPQIVGDKLFQPLFQALLTQFGAENDQKFARDFLTVVGRMHVSVDASAVGTGAETVGSLTHLPRIEVTAADLDKIGSVRSLVLQYLSMCARRTLTIAQPWLQLCVASRQAAVAARRGTTTNIEEDFATLCLAVLQKSIALGWMRQIRCVRSHSLMSDFFLSSSGLSAQFEEAFKQHQACRHRFPFTPELAEALEAYDRRHRIGDADDVLQAWCASFPQTALAQDAGDQGNPPQLSGTMARLLLDSLCCYWFEEPVGTASVSGDTRSSCSSALSVVVARHTSERVFVAERSLHSAVFELFTLRKARGLFQHIVAQPVQDQQYADGGAPTPADEAIVLRGHAVDMIAGESSEALARLSEELLLAGTPALVRLENGDLFRCTLHPSKQAVEDLCIVDSTTSSTAPTWLRNNSELRRHLGLWRDLVLVLELEASIAFKLACSLTARVVGSRSVHTTSVNDTAQTHRSVVTQFFNDAIRMFEPSVMVPRLMQVLCRAHCVVPFDRPMEMALLEEMLLGTGMGRYHISKTYSQPRNPQ